MPLSQLSSVNYIVFTKPQATAHLLGLTGSSTQCVAFQASTISLALSGGLRSQQVDVQKCEKSCICKLLSLYIDTYV